MLKYLKFSGLFHDENFSVNITLENPLDYGFTVETLLFSVNINAKDNKVISLQQKDFKFYIMDEAEYLYNTQNIQTPVNAKPINEELEYQPERLIFTDFKHDFLYQDLRMAFYYRPYRRFNIIELRH